MQRAGEASSLWHQGRVAQALVWVQVWEQMLEGKLISETQSLPIFLGFFSNIFSWGETLPCCSWSLTVWETVVGNLLDGFPLQSGIWAVLGGSISLPGAKKVKETWHTMILEHSAPLEAWDNS